LQDSGWETKKPLADIGKKIIAAAEYKYANMRPKQKVNRK